VFEDFGQANCKSSSSCGTETQNEAPSYDKLVLWPTNRLSYLRVTAYYIVLRNESLL